MGRQTLREVKIRHLNLLLSVSPEEPDAILGPFGLRLFDPWSEQPSVPQLEVPVRRAEDQNLKSNQGWSLYQNPSPSRWIGRPIRSGHVQLAFKEYSLGERHVANCCPGLAALRPGPVVLSRSPAKTGLCFSARRHGNSTPSRPTEVCIAHNVCWAGSSDANLGNTPCCFLQ